MRKLILFSVAAWLVVGATGTAHSDNSVVVTSMSVAKGATGVVVPILISNDVELNGVVVPLILREVTPGTLITSLRLSYGDRLPPSGPLSGVSFVNHYADEDGSCKEGQP